MLFSTLFLCGHFLKQSPQLMHSSSFITGCQKPSSSSSIFIAFLGHICSHILHPVHSYFKFSLFTLFLAPLNIAFSKSLSDSFLSSSIILLISLYSILFSSQLKLLKSLIILFSCFTNFNMLSILVDVSPGKISTKFLLNINENTVPWKESVTMYLAFFI